MERFVPNGSWEVYFTAHASEQVLWQWVCLKKKTKQTKNQIWSAVDIQDLTSLAVLAN